MSDPDARSVRDAASPGDCLRCKSAPEENGCLMITAIPPAAALGITVSSGAARHRSSGISRQPIPSMSRADSASSSVRAETPQHLISPSFHSRWKTSGTQS